MKEYKWMNNEYFFDVTKSKPVILNWKEMAHSSGGEMCSLKKQI